MGYVEDREILAVPSEAWHHVDDLVKLASFIAWHDVGAVVGNTSRNEAFEAMCRLAGVKDPARCYAIVRNGETYVP